MNIIQRLFKKKTSADKVADARQKYFDKFVGFDNVGKPDEKLDWYGRNPEEAMQLADQVVAWMYSPAPRQQPDASGSHRGRH